MEENEFRLTRKYESLHHDYYEAHDDSDIIAFIVPGRHDSKYDNIVILTEDDYNEMKEYNHRLETDLMELELEIEELKRNNTIKSKY